MEVARQTAAAWLVPFGVIALVLLALHLILASHGISYPILDAYGHRQTQTAISAYWFLREGFTLNYITPVLGPPWAIPFEFPTYQTLTAVLAGVTGMDLEVAGRVMSLIFFYAGVGAAVALLLLLRIPPGLAMIAAVLMLASPFYLFWGRTFMIESTATTLGLGAITLFFLALERQRHRWLVIAVVLGTFAALTKVTSYGLFLVFAGLLVLAATVSDLYERRRIDRGMVIRLVYYAAISAIPIVIAVAWNTFADGQKSKNPLADFIVSANLSTWNFGSWDQRFEARTWQAIHERAGLILGAAPIALFSILSLLSPKTRIPGMAALVAFMTGPLLFTNLYVVHEYYFFPGGIFLLLAVALGVIALAEVTGRNAVPVVLLVAFVAVMAARYQSVYPAMIDSTPNNSLMRVGVAVGEHTDPDDVLLIYGIDWKPIIPFYAERRAIMDRRDRPLTDPAIAAALMDVGQENIGAMVVCEYLGRRAAGSVEAKAAALNLVRGPRVGRCDIWFEAGRGE